MSSFTVRPAGTEKDPFRVWLTAASMLGLKLKSGDICEIQAGETTAGKRKLAVAWDGGPGLKDTIVQTSKVLQSAYGFKLGDKIYISRSSRLVEVSSRVILRPSKGSVDKEDIGYWSRKFARTTSGGEAHLVESQTIRGDELTDFLVQDVGSHDAMLVRVTPNTKYLVVNETSSEDSTIINFDPVHLGGLTSQVKQVQRIINDLCYSITKQQFSFYEPKHGILLHGARGTGKTAFTKALSESGWPRVTMWKPGTQLPISDEAHLILVQGEHIGRGHAATKAVTKELGKLFEQLTGTKTLVIGEAQHPNDVDESLRTMDTFVAEIELPIPSVTQREEILLRIRGKEISPSDDVLRLMSGKTHGYVGADLKKLLFEICNTAAEASPPANAHDGELPRVTVTSEHLETALKLVGPSALQEIIIEKPNVRWSDIGGQHDIKRQLHDAVERPLKLADVMQQMQLRPKKGILLYGPPGCSKTLLVRALATETDLNFLAVKGAELLNQYVGESERATREVFRKARAASPCIIFFDEIDAIASRRRSENGLNVLTTLLTEMDGFEELKNVFVVAATNTPQTIDPALMRPGRFDNAVYIGPPDAEARKEIFRKQLTTVYERLDEDIESFVGATEGLSGAEVVAIYQTAGDHALAAGRRTVTSDDMEQAIQNTPKSITAEMLQQFEDWNASRRGPRLRDNKLRQDYYGIEL